MFWRKGELRGCFTARGESLAAFDGRCIPSGCVAPRSNTPGILARRALPAGRIAALGATLDFHHGLLAEADRLTPPHGAQSAPGGPRSLMGLLRPAPLPRAPRAAAARGT